MNDNNFEELLVKLRSHTGISIANDSVVGDFTKCVMAGMCAKVVEFTAAQFFGSI